MQRCPIRTYDETIMDDPVARRLKEALELNSESLKMLINEKFGDGVMSSVDMKIKVQKVKSDTGDKVQIIMEGKYCPFTEQIDGETVNTKE